MSTAAAAKPTKARAAVPAAGLRSSTERTAFCGGERLEATRPARERVRGSSENGEM